MNHHVYGRCKSFLVFLGTIPVGGQFRVYDPSRANSPSGVVINNHSGSVDVEINSVRYNWAPSSEVVLVDERRQRLYESVPEDYKMPILDWKKKKDGTAFRATIEERVYLVERDGKKFVLTCGEDKLEKGTADACKEAAQTHCNRKPPARVTTDMAVMVCKRAIAKGVSVEDYCADKAGLKASGLDPDYITAEVIRQAVRWQQERPVNAPQATPAFVLHGSQSFDAEGPANAVQPRQRAARTGTAPGKGGYRIFGYPSLGIIHWMGVQNFTVEQAQKVLHLNGVTEITDANVGYRLKAGRRPNGKPADLTPEQQTQIRREAGLEVPKKGKK